MSDWEVSVTIALIAGSFLMAYLYANTDKLNKFLKLLFLGAALLLSIASLAIQEDIINANQPTSNATLLAAVYSTYNMQIWVFRIVLIGILLYIIYSGTMYMLGKPIKGPEEDN